MYILAVNLDVSFSCELGFDKLCKLGCGIYNVGCEFKICLVIQIHVIIILQFVQVDWLFKNCHEVKATKWTLI